LLCQRNAIRSANKLAPTISTFRSQLIVVGNRESGLNWQKRSW
jgi:hypothetical protein